MDSLKKIALLVVLLTSYAFAQSQVTVTGTIQSPSGALATSGFVEFDLSPLSSGLLYSVVGTTVIAPQTAKCGINASGVVQNLALSGPCMIWPNDLITPANSLYTVKIAPNNSIAETISNVFLSSLTPTNNLSNLTILKPTQVIGTVISGSPLVTMSIVPSLANQWSVGSPQLHYAQGYFNALNLSYLFPTPLTVTQMLALGHTTGRAVFVTDSNGSCLVGGGSTPVWCYDTGTNYFPIGGAAPTLVTGISFILPTPLVGDSGVYQYENNNGVPLTLLQVDCSTDTGTVGINFDLRTILTSNTQSSLLLSSTFVCDSAGESNNQFVTATVGANQILALDIISVTGTPNALRVHVKHQ